MKIIRTKYLGPTNTLGSRVKAETSEQSYTCSIDNAYTVEYNERLAAQHLAKTFGWGKVSYAGSFNGYSFYSLEGCADWAPTR